MTPIEQTVSAMRLIRQKLTDHVVYHEQSAAYYRAAIDDLDVNLTRMEGVLMEQKEVMGGPDPTVAAPHTGAPEEPNAEPKPETVVEAEPTTEPEPAKEAVEAEPVAEVTADPIVEAEAVEAEPANVAAEPAVEVEPDPVSA